MTALDRHEKTRSIGSKVACRATLNNQSVVPDWVDKDKLLAGQQFARKHLFSVFFAHLAGLIFTLHVPSLLNPLLFTGNSDSVLLLFGRYLRTLKHVKKWYEGDIWDPEDPAGQSIRQVAEMHNRVAEKLDKDNQDAISLSNHDMVITQFGFIGLIMLYPHQMGISCTNEELESLIHFWRAVGHSIGIEDQYNLCSEDNLEQTKVICRSLLQNEIKKSMVTSPPVSVAMGRGIVIGVNTYIPCLTWPSFNKYLCAVTNIDDPTVLTWYCDLCYRATRLVFTYMLHFVVFRMMFNGLLRLALVLVEGRRKRIERRLQSRYPIDIRGACPIAGRTN